MATKKLTTIAGIPCAQKSKREADAHVAVPRLGAQPNTYATTLIRKRLWNLWGKGA